MTEGIFCQWLQDRAVVASDVLHPGFDISSRSAEYGRLGDAV
jgi:hypothetical protein